ncbi:MAG: hypothetical protein ACKVTZ_10980 [Bacteroidia bacterium]
MLKNKTHLLFPILWIFIPILSIAQETRLSIVSWLLPSDSVFLAHNPVHPQIAMWVDTLLFDVMKQKIPCFAALTFPAQTKAPYKTRDSIKVDERLYNPYVYVTDEFQKPFLGDVTPYEKSVNLSYLHQRLKFTVTHRLKKKGKVNVIEGKLYLGFYEPILNKNYFFCYVKMSDLKKYKINIAGKNTNLLAYLEKHFFEITIPTSYKFLDGNCHTHADIDVFGIPNPQYEYDAKEQNKPSEPNTYRWFTEKYYQKKWCELANNICKFTEEDIYLPCITAPTPLLYDDVNFMKSAYYYLYCKEK